MSPEGFGYPLCILAVVYIFGLLTLIASPASADIAGTASVIDGDTIEIHGQRIRFHGIDAPESRQTCVAGGEEWRCGQEAALALAELIGRSPVLEDALRVFVAFAAGSDEWRRLCDWTDVTAELSEQSRPVVVILIVGAAAAAAVWFLFSVLFDAFGLAKP